MELAPPYPSTHCSNLSNSSYKYIRNPSVSHVNLDSLKLTRSTISTGVQFRNEQKQKWIKNQTLSNNNTADVEIFARISSVLELCSSIKYMKQLHAQIFRHGLEQDVLLGTQLASLYQKYGNMKNALIVFDKIAKADVFSWNVMIRGYARNGPYDKALALYYQMQEDGLQPDKFTFPFVFKACGELSALQEGKKIHDDIVGSGFEHNRFVENSLVAMYAKCGRIDVARQVFDKMPEKDVVSWTALIDGFVQNGHANEALTLFDQMKLAGYDPNEVTLVSVLQACAHLRALQEGKWIHDYVIERGFVSNVSVRSSLVYMYAKCGDLTVARQLMDSMSRTDLVSWNAIIAGYTQNGYANEALEIFQQMQLANLWPNSVTMVSVLQACAHLAALQQGKCIHGYAVKSGVVFDVVLTTALIDMYAKGGNMGIARMLFAEMSSRNEICWNAIIAGHVQNGQYSGALTFFNLMLLTDIKPNCVTMITVLPACAHLAALHQGKAIHSYITKSGFESDVFAGNSLIDMYNKCGSLENSRQMFNKMFQRDVVSWNTMISGYSMHGHGEDALVLFSQMQQTDINPDSITFIHVLSACSHAGLVEKGREYFDCMSRNYCITPKAQHYACMVDLLGRAGYLNEAKDLVEKMPDEPGASVWGALLGACRIHHNIQLGECVAKRLFDLEPDNSGYYVLLSNIYAASGRWDDVSKIRTIMKDRGIRKVPGSSLVR